MNKEYVLKRNKEYEEKILSLRSSIDNVFKEIERDCYEYKREIMAINRAKKMFYKNDSSAITTISLLEHVFSYSEETEFSPEFKAKINLLLSLMEEAKVGRPYINVYNSVLDSEPMHFSGDILVTDPCYIVKRELENSVDDWGFCDYGYQLNKLGINHFMTRDTIYGDWGCTIYDENNHEIGKFCADAGLVTVCDYNEVLAYNPDFDEWRKSHEWCATVIKDFEGTVQFLVYEEKDSNHNDFYVVVVIEGVNLKTGESIKYSTLQTSL